jgi:hypothetical protein
MLLLTSSTFEILLPERPIENEKYHFHQTVQENNQLELPAYVTQGVSKEFRIDFEVSAFLQKTETSKAPCVTSVIHH